MENIEKKLEEVELNLQNEHKQQIVVLDEISSICKHLTALNDSMKSWELNVNDQITKSLKVYNKEMLEVKTRLLEIDQKLISVEETLSLHKSQFELNRKNLEDFRIDYDIYREITIKIEEGGIMKTDYFKDICKFANLQVLKF